MSIFKPQFDNFSTKPFVLPADEWELEVASLKLKSVDIKKGERAGQKMHMLSVSNKVIQTVGGDTEHQNKAVTFDIIINPDQQDGFNRALKLAMACVGINSGSNEADAEFVQRFGNDDWSVDVDSGELGDAWKGLVKSRYIAVTKVGGNLEYPRAELSYARPF